MAWSIKQDWESTKNELARYVDAERVVLDMDAGGCLKKFKTALENCDRDWYTRSNGGIDRKPGEVIPVSAEKCVEATVALRGCMQRNPVVFRQHIVAMDEGIEEDERQRGRPDVEVEDGSRFRWWTGMRKS